MMSSPPADFPAAFFLAAMFCPYPPSFRIAVLCGALRLRAKRSPKRDGGSYGFPPRSQTKNTGIGPLRPEIHTSGPDSLGARRSNPEHAVPGARKVHDHLAHLGRASTQRDFLRGGGDEFALHRVKSIVVGEHAQLHSGFEPVRIPPILLRCG